MDPSQADSPNTQRDVPTPGGGHVREHDIHVREFTRHVDEQQRWPIFMFVNMAF